MNACIFLGPTLPVETARAALDAVYLPPAAQGDVYRAALRKPQAIGIIDGYFECIPAVWHKEILWALAQGIQVFGCSSMGALRAAELAAFGMEGVGKIFEAFREGRLEDDDEVAVAHTPASHNYQSASVALVNIRATLAAAAEAGIIGRATRRRLERIAKAIPYAERSYPAVLERGTRAFGSSQEREEFRGWLPGGAVDQKQMDALAMLRLMRARLEGGAPAKQVEFAFEYTANWEIARSRAGRLHLDIQGSPRTMLLDRLLDELRLEGESYRRTRRAALLRFLALEEAWRQGMVPGEAAIAAAAESFRQERGIAEAEDFDRWLRENHLSAEQFRELMKDEACLEWVANLAETEVQALAPDVLRVHGEYAERAARAEEKQSKLESQGLPNPGILDTGMGEEELLRRYFEQRLGRPVAADLGTFSRAAGFENEGSFRRAILREYCYTGLSKGGSGVG